MVMATTVVTEVWGPPGMRRTATMPGRNIAYSIRQAVFVARHGSRVDSALAGGIAKGHGTETASGHAASTAGPLGQDTAQRTTARPWGVSMATSTRSSRPAEVVRRWELDG